MNSKSATLTIYSSLHFLVDFACAFLLFRCLRSSSEWQLLMLLYNFCAFAMQMPLGILADKWNRNAGVASLGCVLVALAYGCTAMPIIAALVSGLGNGLFHVGGGLEVLNVSERKLGMLGVFVSPGALGIYLGRIAGKQTLVPTMLCVPILIGAAAVVLGASVMRSGSIRSSNTSFSLAPCASLTAIGITACMFFVVCLRSYAGMAQNFSWKSQDFWGLAIVSATVLGKACGGFLADRFGALRISSYTLGLCSLLFLGSERYAALGVTAVFLFNMTMPITLGTLANLLPGAKGFSFGLLTFALFLGFLPGYFGSTPPFSTTVLLSVAALLSMPFLCIGLRRAKE